MRLAQYTQAERTIRATDGDTIRDRWIYGLRLLNDPEKIAPAGGLKHGVAEALIEAAKRYGISLSNREIRYRLQAARSYPTEAQIGKALADFGTWWNLIQAMFPPIERPEDEPDADYRTAAERRRAAARAMAELGAEQLALFPLDEFEPDAATLADLHEYAAKQAAITAGFVATGDRRAEYLAELDDAAEDDLTMTWAEAHRLAFGDNPA